MLKHLTLITLTSLFLALCRSGHAYELQSHRVMSLNAAQASVLGSGTKMQQLGLLPIGWPTQRFLSSPSTDTVTQQCIHGTAMTVWDLIGCGAQFEDVPGGRSFNHFYDPWNDRPLSVGGIQFGSRSPDWALEDRGAINGQDNSYSDARRSFVEALTTTNNTSRAAAWGRTFQSLGQVIHHLQDMGQPQHVRNDDHCDKSVCRPLLAYKPSRYERYATQRNSVVSSISSTADGYSIYPTLQKSLLLPRDFWMAPNGIAGYTNQRYVSAGTNFTVLKGVSAPGSVYPLPLPDDSKSETLPVQAAYSALRKPIPDSIADFCKNNDCNLTLVPTRDGLSRAATLSIFDQDLTANRTQVTLFNDLTGANFQVDRVYSLNALNFDAAFPDLISRATAYSAGLLNYFFRGQLGISLPDAGVFSIGDLSTAQGCLADCGFRSVRLKVANLTPGNESIGKGKLWAVAKFHRNNCFSLDRSGQYGAEGNDWLGRHCRDDAENIVISSPINITAGIPTTSIEYAFDFRANQIPFSATDLYLQVMFQGDLGAESGNAVAVGTSDIMEPTFWTLENDEDYQIWFKTTECNIADATVTYVGGVGTANNRGFGLRFESATNDQVTGSVANGEYAVVAYLTSSPTVWWHFHDNINWFSDQVESTSRDQMDVETGVLRPSSYWRKRNDFEGGQADFGTSYTGAVFADDNCPWNDDVVFSIIDDLPASAAPMKSVTVNLAGVDGMVLTPGVEFRPFDQQPRMRSSQRRAVNAPLRANGGN
jgi:hypothetical protein